MNPMPRQRMVAWVWNNGCIRGYMRKTLIILIFSTICLAAVWLAYQLHQHSLRDKAIKLDYFTVNQIKYGLLSGDKWTFQVNNIITKQIDSFQLTSTNKRVIHEQINAILSRMLDEVEIVLHKKQDKLGDKIKFKVLNTLVDMDKFRAEIPRFSHAIVDELEKSKNKDELKAILREKVSGILNAASQDTLGEQQKIIQKHGYTNLALFNKMVERETAKIRENQDNLGYFMLSLLIMTLIVWVYIFSIRRHYALSFLFSVVISCIALFIGVSLPMIEIDARIGELDLKLLSSHILFNDQVIFFQTKSILDVIRIMLQHGKMDSIFVGILILAFSVLFPVTKLICTTVYLFMRERSNGFIRYMAFNSGKWSMADVMVVAIFMSYVGFQGILDDQLADIAMKNDVLNLVTTNNTNLQTGFILFVGFVVFNLILAEILKEIGRENRSRDTKKAIP